MADLTYNVRVNTQQAQQSIGSLRTALGGLAAAFSIREVTQFADGITNLRNRLRTISADAADVEQRFQDIVSISNDSRTSLDQVAVLYSRIAMSARDLGISQAQTATLTDTISKALQLSGATAAEAGSAMLQLSQAFSSGTLRGEELNAMLEAAPVLARILADSMGVPIGQLRKLGEQGKLTSQQVAQAFIQANASVTDTFGRSIPTIGQSLEQVRNAFTILFANIESQTGVASNISQAILSLAESLKSLSNDAQAVRSAVVIITELITAAAKVAGVVLAFTLLGRAFALLRGGLALLQRAWASSVGNIAGAVASLGKTFNWLMSSIRGIVSGNIPLERSIAVLGTRFKFLSQGLALLAKGFTTLGVLIYGAVEAVRAFFNIQSGLDRANKQAGDSLQQHSAHVQAYRDNLARQQAEQIKAAQQARLYAQAMSEVTEEIARQNRGYRDNFKSQLDGIKAQNSAMNQSQAQQKLSTALQEAERTFLQQRIALQDQLRDAIRDSQAQSGKDEEARVRASASIPVLRQALESLNQQYRDQRLAITGLLAVQEEYTRVRELQTFATQQAQRAEDELIRIQREMARGSMTEVEQAYARIRDAADDSARAAIRAEEARRGAPLSTAEIENYYRVARTGVERLQRATAAQIRQQRSFSEGWKKAYNEYADAATNAATRAQNIFRTVTQGMEDMIVNFAKTGKFEFRDFVNSILEELLRSQIREVMASIFNPQGGLFGGLGELFGGLFGGGKSGTQQRGNSPSQPLFVQMVGGSGAAAQGGMSQLTSLLGGGSSRPQTRVGTPGFGTPTSGGGLLDTIGKITSTISGGVGRAASAIGSVGSWINKNIFGGFFANGGLLPAGKVGIVGERGPEMITGPAQITPMPATQVTYNINAVDAASFQALLARDPRLIYSLTEQGRRSFAGAR